MKNYRGDFIVNHIDKIKNKIVLELAAGHGAVSENIIEAEPLKFYISDNHPTFFNVDLFKHIHQCLFIDIIHDLKEFYQNNNVDTVVCCGFLYHTAHPIWAIEQILIGKPKFFYLETIFTDKPNEIWYNIEEPDKLGNATKYEGQATIHLILPVDVIILSCQTLGYKLIDTIKRTTNSKIDDDPYRYHKFWQKTTGLWFERT